MKVSTLEREIHFYRIEVGGEESGQPKKFDPLPVLEHIANLKWTKNARYWDDGHGKFLACWVDDFENKPYNKPYKIRFGSIRRSDFPQVERLGKIKPLNISPASGLVEQTHIVFFEDNIAGCDYNYYGPRITSLPYYLGAKALDVVPHGLNFCQLLRQSVYIELAQIKHLKLFSLKIQRAYADAIQGIDISLAEAFRAAIAAGDAEEVEVILRAPRGKGKWLSDGLLKTSRRILSRDSLQAKKFNIKGYNADLSEAMDLNLLSDKFIVRKKILKVDERSRALQQEDAYKVIIETFNESRADLLISPSVRS